jgi:hypothetical protein
MIRHRVILTEAEVVELSLIINKGAHTTYTFRNAYILLYCEEGVYGQKIGNEQLSKLLREQPRR